MKTSEKHNPGTLDLHELYAYKPEDLIGVTQLTFIIERSIYIDNAYNIRAYNEAAFRCRLYQLPHRSSMRRFLCKSR